jgi:para-nitrobenzyl esterase
VKREENMSSGSRIGWAQGRPWAGLVVVIVSLLQACVLAACAGEMASTADVAGPAELRPTQPVAVDGGRVTGLDSGDLRVFRGIPYAAPPVGELRWRPPRRVRPWSGVRACTSYGPSCPQSGKVVGGGQLPSSENEDCLYLNVWTPARARSERLPVMVWIHGGGFITGSGSLPAGNGENLSRRENVVVVSLNYRLGVFGFLAHPELSAESPHRVSGNYGLLDQQAALRWVRRNIAAFGGDPRRVTIFGQSAGGQSVIDQLVSPLSRGLFAGAISESPRYEDRGVGIWSTLTLQEQEQEGEEVGDLLGIEDGPGALAALRRLPAARLVSATASPRSPLPSLFIRPPQPSFQPVVDGWVLPDEPWRLLSSGRWAKVPLLVGSTSDECDMWLGDVKPGIADEVAVASRGRVRWFTGDDWPVLDGLFPAADYGGLLPATSRMMTVLEFNTSARFAAECAAVEGVPAYLYYFSRHRPGSPSGARHSAEVPYVFASVGALDGSGQPEPDDARLCRIVSHYWATFAATGDPNADGLPEWPRYDPVRDVLLRLDVPVIASPAPYVPACEIGEQADQSH